MTDEEKVNEIETDILYLFAKNKVSMNTAANAMIEILVLISVVEEVPVDKLKKIIENAIDGYHSLHSKKYFK